MASVKGVNITNLDSTPSVKASSEQVGGKIRVFHDTFEASSLASGSDITMARLPAFATIHDVVVKCDALGGSSTLKVGDSGENTGDIISNSSYSTAFKSLVSGNLISKVIDKLKALMFSDHVK